jgi:hypothetical protein
MMKTWFWIVLVAFLLLAGYVILGLVQRPRTQAQPAAVPFEVGAESIAAYEQRAVELRATADSLKLRMVAAGTAERRDVKVRVAEVERLISELQRAIAQWRIARGGDAPDAAYRQCVLLYGRAKGACGMLAPDTLPGK